MSAPPPTPAPSRPPASPIGIGVIGCGSISRAHAVALRLVGDDGLVRVVAVSDPDPEAVERFVRIAGGDPRRPATAADLIADPEVDAVVVIAPTRFHREIIGAVAAAGKACFTEKPLAPTFDVVQDIAAVVAGAGIPTQVGFQTRFQPLYRQLHADVSEGTHGRVMAYLLRDDQFWPTGAVVPGHSDWRSQRSEAGGGALLEHSIHSCDVLTWCFGPVRRVTAATRAVFGYDVEDVATLMIEHESGVIGTLVTVFNGVRHREERLPLADRHHRFPRRVGKQFVKPPDAAEGQRVAAPHPLAFENLEGRRGPQAIPVVGHVEQVAAGRAARQDLVDGERGAARRRDALLKREIGASDDGHDGVSNTALPSVGTAAAVGRVFRGKKSPRWLQR